MVSLSQLKKWQDDMGVYCDAKVNIPILQELTNKNPDMELSYECGIITGYMLYNVKVSVNEIKESIKE